MNELAKLFGESLTAARARKGSTELPLWSPLPGKPQETYYNSDVYEVLYGGAAGGAKTAGTLGFLTKWVHHPQFRALVLRRKTPDLRDLLEKARRIYKVGEATSPRPYRGWDPKCKIVTAPVPEIRFASGAKIILDHCQSDDGWSRFAGFEMCVIGFDECVYFTEKQYTEISARIRSTAPGLPKYLRLTSNPDTEAPGFPWVFRRWGAWLNPKVEVPWLPPRYDEHGTRLPPAPPGHVLWFRRNGDTEEVVPPGTDGATSRTYIPARVTDNPVLMAADPEYVVRLAQLDPVRQAQLLRGDWTATYKGLGTVFKRDWFEPAFGPMVGDHIIRVRAWDIAGSEPTEQNPDPDWTIGLLYAFDPATGRYRVEDVVAAQEAFGAVDQLMRSTAERDGPDVSIRVPVDPAAAGKRAAAEMVQLLEGFHVIAVSEKEGGNKLRRARGVASQAHPASTGGKYGRVSVVEAPWNEDFFRNLEAFPDGRHDDYVDGLSGAHDAIRILMDGGGAGSVGARVA